MQTLKTSTADQPLLFQLIDSSDHISGKTGLTPTVTLSKNGGSFASPAGAITEIANGWYKVAANATDANTKGPLLLHATGTGADPTDVLFFVGDTDPLTGAFSGSVATQISIALDDSTTGGQVLANGTAISAVKTKTDQFVFTTENQVDANVIVKTGFSLSSTGLDSITVTAPTGVAATFPAMLVQLWRRFFKKSTLTASQLKTFADDGTTVVTTQTVSDDSTTQTQGNAA